MIFEEMSKALCAQMVFEVYSAYVYIGFAAKLEKMKTPGAAHWMRVQTDEELIHADMFYKYLVSRDAAIEFGQIAKPELSKVVTPVSAFECALKHETIVSERINSLYALALSMNDFPTMNFLNHFLTEQIEEEKNVRDIIDRFSITGTSPESILLLDCELGKRADVKEK